MWCPKGVQKQQKVVIGQNPYPILGGESKLTFLKNQEKQ